MILRVITFPRWETSLQTPELHKRHDFREMKKTFLISFLFFFFFLCTLLFISELLLLQTIVHS